MASASERLAVFAADLDFAAIPAAVVEKAKLHLLVDHAVDPEAEFPLRFGGAVRLHLRGGRVLEARERVNRGSAERPLTRAEVEEKFLRNARRAVHEERAVRVIEAAKTLEKAASLEALVSALALEGRASRGHGGAEAPPSTVDDGAKTPAATIQHAAEAAAGPVRGARRSP